MATEYDAQRVGPLDADYYYYYYYYYYCGLTTLGDI